MKYSEFKKKVLDLPYIASKNTLFFKEDEQITRNQLNRWKNKGLIIKLKRGLYVLNENDRKINPSRTFLANQLYSPSYVSLEYALSFYGLIPERVFDVTSVTTKKTNIISNNFGKFVYRKVKSKAYRGFKSVKDESGWDFFIALPEKVIIDFFYLNIDRFKKVEMSMFRDSYRFQNTENLNAEKMFDFAKLFDSKELMRITQVFSNFLKEG